ETRDRYPGAPEVLPIEVVENQNFTLGNKTVVPINIMHGKLPIFGYRIGDFVYITDAKVIHPEEDEKLKGVKVLVVNALREEPHDLHFNLQDALDFISRVDRKSTRLNSSHVKISYAVFCLKKKKK